MQALKLLHLVKLLRVQSLACSMKFLATQGVPLQVITSTVVLHECLIKSGAYLRQLKLTAADLGGDFINRLQERPDILS